MSRVLEEEQYSAPNLRKLASNGVAEGKPACGTVAELEGLSINLVTEETNEEMMAGGYTPDDRKLNYVGKKPRLVEVVEVEERKLDDRASLLVEKIERFGEGRNSVEEEHQGKKNTRKQVYARKAPKKEAPRKSSLNKTQVAEVMRELLAGVPELAAAQTKQKQYNVSVVEAGASEDVTEQNSRQRSRANMDSLNLSFNGRKTGTDFGSAILSRDSKPESRAEEVFKTYFKKEDVLERVSRRRESTT